MLQAKWWEIGDKARLGESNDIDQSREIKVASLWTKQWITYFPIIESDSWDVNTHYIIPVVIKRLTSAILIINSVTVVFKTNVQLPGLLNENGEK